MTPARFEGDASGMSQAGEEMCGARRGGYLRACGEGTGSGKGFLWVCATAASAWQPWVGSSCALLLGGRCRSGWGMLSARVAQGRGEAATPFVSRGGSEVVEIFKASELGHGAGLCCRLGLVWPRPL